MNTQTRKPIIVLSIVLLLTTGLLTACSSSSNEAADKNVSSDTPVVQVCTEIGCVDGLTVQLEGVIPSTFTVEAVVPGDSPILVQCSSDQPAIPCAGDHLFFEGFTPEEVTIRISWKDGQVSETFRPSYERVQPNGPGCPPECRQGHVTMMLTE